MAYQYEPLMSKKHIRILELEPAEDASASLRCSIVQQELQNLDQQYDAISYTWGGQVRNSPLEAQTGIIAITPNLAAALTRLRSRYRVKRLWADAVCINQADDAEKSQQIPLMPSIFGRATNVRAWLGDESDATCVTGMKLLIRISQAGGPSTTLPGLDQTSWSAIAKFLSLPWFSRRWIIQELVVNTHPVLYLGRHKLPWSTLSAAIDMMSQKREELRGAMHNLSSLSMLSRLWWIWCRAGRDDHSILSLLDSFSFSECEDPRDRLFALIGVASDVSTSVVNMRPGCLYIETDYSYEPFQVYRKFTLELMKRDGVAATLYQATKWQRTDAAEIFPSWALDLRQKTRPHIWSDRYIAQSHWQDRMKVLTEDNDSAGRHINVRLDLIHFASSDAISGSGIQVLHVVTRPLDVEQSHMILALQDLFRTFTLWAEESQMILNNLGDISDQPQSPLVWFCRGLLNFQSATMGDTSVDGIAFQEYLDTALDTTRSDSAQSEGFLKSHSIDELLQKWRGLSFFMSTQWQHTFRSRPYRDYVWGFGPQNVQINDLLLYAKPTYYYPNGPLILRPRASGYQVVGFGWSSGLSGNHALLDGEKFQEIDIKLV